MIRFGNDIIAIGEVRALIGRDLHFNDGKVVVVSEETAQAIRDRFTQKPAE